MRHPKFSHIEIKLNDMEDSYTMVFFKIHNGKVVRKEEREGLYSDDLHITIREVTGLATSMPNVRFS